MMTHAICQECKEEFDYELKVGYPRKYCPECSAAKKAEYAERSRPEDMERPVTIVRPGESVATIGKQGELGLIENKNKPKNGNTAMYVSYAKDIFCNIINATEGKGGDVKVEDTMNVAIAVGKQAKEAFEQQNKDLLIYYF